MPSLSAIHSITESFNTIINRLSRQGAHCDVLLKYASLLHNRILPDANTFPSLLKACASLDLYYPGLSLHQHCIVNGYSSDAYIGSSLIDFYAKFGYSHYARHVFESMPERNVVPWTTMIRCYSRAGELSTCLCMYNRMQHQGIRPSSVTILVILSGISEGIYVQCLHGAIIRLGFCTDLSLLNSLLYVYGKCYRVEDARCLFDSMCIRDVISWNSMINVYSIVGDVKETLHLANMMRMEDVEPNRQTFNSLVSANAKQGNFKIGRLLHARVLTDGFELDMHIKTSLVVMYLKCKNHDDAFRIFDQIKDKDNILWTALISGLVQDEFPDKAIEVFRKMVLSRTMPSTATIASILAACAQLGSFNLGVSIHAYVLRKNMIIDLPAQNSLITMYAKCGRPIQSCAVFDLMLERDLISWNSVVAGQAQNNNLSKSLLLFSQMRRTKHRPDSITIISLLQVCAVNGALQQGRWIHNHVIRNFLRPCFLIDTALVDMYSKCGNINAAKKCFDLILQHDLVSWSVIIDAYGSHGQGQTALEMYHKFLLAGFVPNHVIFLSVLSSCCHNGLLKEGISLFYSMQSEFGVEPELEHLACVVDLFCRAGRVRNAYEFYKKMFSEQVGGVLGILVDACRAQNDLELGDIVAREILEMKPEDGAGNYLQLAHRSASMERWDGVSKAWVQMRSLGLKKIPGWSFIELHGSIWTFFNHHSSHPQYEDIVSILKILSNETKEVGIDDKANTSVSLIY
ncbi:pentatricopeptide repeat-containing protein At4g04370 [Impatiens glandulifera]|uniref:pentatricopeptide repeat-containing protein At4g04370 n=1 Tax=Impatiens glandulifera TaxID=253017 RepID=UPI001FB05DA1|nr:pentatricopeptide repeat-containing protein At4g04370 [Impatiens glandulifera]